MDRAYMRAVVLYDCPKEINDKSWICKSLQDHGYIVKDIFPGKNKFSLLYRKRFGEVRVCLWMLVMSLDAILNSAEDDTIIFTWKHTQALVLHEICRILHLKRHIVSFLWMNPTKKERNIFKRTERACIQDSYFLALTNSKEQISKWKEILSLDANNILYFPDVYDPKDQFLDFSSKSQRYVFSGGYSHRDWKTFLDVVKGCPTIKFKCIAMRENWDANWMIPQNLQVYFDVSADFYYECMKNSFMTVIVCNEGTTAGLINVIKSMQYALIPLVTYNESVSKYYNDPYKRYLVHGNIEETFCELINEINNYADNEYSHIVNDMQNFIKNNFSGEKNMDALIKYAEKT